ncbi:response regulator [Massilia sp. 9096]|uniref:response regulator n=1 Tax=Massilia sp. 9096 TaxID=1500894 RepID=UPI000B1252A3|nr:response regulator [Massilia sp. 9096]
MNPDTGIALLFAPIAGDSQTLQALLAGQGLGVAVCASPQAFYDQLGQDAMLAVVTEEALVRCNAQAMRAALARQPAWSDLPILGLVGGDAARVDNDRFHNLAAIGNVTLVERPTSREVLLTSIRSAIRARRLQYAVRGHWRELELHASRLETMVDERTHALAREVTERSRVEAELEAARRLESLGRLTGGVAHDFNNLLQVIAGGETLIRLLLGKQMDPRIERALESVHRAAEHGASLTQRLLAYARRQPLANVTLDLRAHLFSTADLLLRSLDRRIDLRSSLAADLWQVEADPAQLDAAILNVVGNAGDAMPHGGRLTMAARNVAMPAADLPEARQLSGDYACLTITDSGEGMSDDVAIRAFEPFYTTKAVGKGTGLGLSQVYGFAMQSRGLAFIRREPIGTTIGILLPRSAAAQATAAVPQVRARPDRLEGMHLLYVEDDPGVAEMTVELLRGLGAEVVLAENADAAIALDLAGFDLVLSDVMMPGSMDGFGLACWLSQHHPALPIVLCSGYMLDPQRLQSLQVEFVRKPYRFAELIEVIRRVLDNASSR